MTVMWLRSASIKRILTLIMMGIGVICVLLTTTALTFIGIYNLQRDAERRLELLATSTGDRNRASIEFDSPETARDNLKLVFIDSKSIRRACLYTLEREVFASYIASAGLSNSDCPETFSLGSEYDPDTNNLKIAQPIASVSGGNATIGYVFLESDLREIHEFTYDQAITAIVVAVAAILVAYLLSTILQSTISRPILKLAATAREVSTKKDYSVRASSDAGLEKNSNELGTLFSSFNQMLSEIEERDRQLLRKTVELEKARDAAESSNRAKSHFLANISHELRTPLNAIIGFSSILMNQLFGAIGSEKYIEYSKDINEAGTHLLDVINDILDLSKAEAGKLTLNFEEVNVKQAIKKCMTIVSERAASGGVTLHTNIPEKLPYLIADRLRFIQIVLNVLSNAIKFTESGGHVTLTVKTHLEHDKLVAFHVIVSDTGIGMAPDHIEKAFQSFGQVDSDLNRKYEGTGLGLPLTKMLMELHYGNIQVESKLGEGTTVTLYFPADPHVFEPPADTLEGNS